jgi:hypothetical protein
MNTFVRTLAIVTALACALPAIADAGPRGGGGGGGPRGGGGGGRPAPSRPAPSRPAPSQPSRGGLGLSNDYKPPANNGGRPNGANNGSRPNNGANNGNRPNNGNNNPNRPNNGNNNPNRPNTNNPGNRPNTGGNNGNNNNGNRNNNNNNNNRNNNNTNINRNTNINNTNINRNVYVNNPVYGGGGAWGWNHGVAWAPAYGYYGGGFWGAFAIGVTSAAVFGAIVSSNNQQIVSYQVQPSSPGATMLSNYQLTQTQCGPPNLVIIFGPNNSVICAYPNNLVSAGSYNLDPSTLSLTSQ